MILIEKCVSALIFLCLVFGVNHSYGQQDIKLNSYVVIFVDKLDQWDNKKLVLFKKDLQGRFERKLKWRGEYRPYGDETAEWYQRGIQLWNELPPRLESKLKLSEVSRNLLYSIYYANLPMYHRYIDITGLDIAQDLDVSFFGVLGIAQTIAVKNQLKELTAPYIAVSLEKNKKTYHCRSVQSHRNPNDD